MSDKDKDPPLADKPKLSSLTDFEIKALKLQKEGKLDELKQEIEVVTGKSADDTPAEEPERDTTKASVEEMRVYENLVQKVKNPVSLDKVPPRIRKEIEEGLSLLKEIVNDKERFEKYREMHNNAFKKQKENDNPFKPPVLPDELKAPVSELKAKPSGDVSTKKAKEPEPAVSVKKEETVDEKISFINDINTDTAAAYRPAPEPDYETEEMKYNEPSLETSRPTLDLITNCQHCGWDLKRNDLVTVSEDDKHDFVQSILGGIRFKKVYSLFDDKYKISFRSLTSKESDMAYRQIVIDGQKDFKGRALGGTDFYWRNLQAYRMVMSLESIESVQYGKIEIPSIEDADIEEFSGGSLQDKLIPFLNYVLDNYLPLESTRSVVGHAYFEFQSLCDKLQVMAESPTFWKAIG
jgi:hypothetical protein